MLITAAYEAVTITRFIAFSPTQKPTACAVELLLASDDENLVTLTNMYGLLPLRPEVYFNFNTNR
jgi:hypothetical protein